MPCEATVCGWDTSTHQIVKSAYLRMWSARSTRHPCASTREAIASSLHLNVGSATGWTGLYRQGPTVDAVVPTGKRLAFTGNAEFCLSCWMDAETPTQMNRPVKTARREQCRCKQSRLVCCGNHHNGRIGFQTVKLGEHLIQQGLTLAL